MWDALNYTSTYNVGGDSVQSYVNSMGTSSYGKSAEDYYNEGVSYLNNANASISDILNYFPSTNPAQTYSTTYNGQTISATTPTVRSNNELIESLGVASTYYDYDSILSSLNTATNEAYESQISTLSDSITGYKRNMANNQYSAMDLINNQFNQGTTTAVAKSLTGAQTLSTMLDYSQTTSDVVNDLNTSLNALGSSWQSTLASNETVAMNHYNTSADTLSDLAESLYSDDILWYQALQNYNATIEELNENYQANVTSADSTYSDSLVTLAKAIFSNNQSMKEALANSSVNAYASDVYSSAYLTAAQNAAAATIKSAEEAAAATTASVSQTQVGNKLYTTYSISQPTYNTYSVSTDYTPTASTTSFTDALNALALAKSLNNTTF